jgi:peptide/nickel transport system permease protein
VVAVALAHRPARRRLRLRATDLTFLFGLVVMGAFVLAAVLAPLLAGHDPAHQDLESRLLPPLPLAGSEAAYPLGTDQLGRDVWSRIAYGARISLLVAFSAVVGAGTVGVVLGLIAGYAGGKIDGLIMGLVDAQLALPFVLLAIALVLTLGAGLLIIVVVLVISGWVAYARVVRALVLTLKNREFVEAARSIGASHARIIARHIFPNTVSVIVVIAALQVAEMMITEAALSFLGFGIQPPTPSWGNMIADGRTYLARAWWVATLPGISITLCVMAMMFLGDRLRDSLDPRSRDRGGGAR